MVEKLHESLPVEIIEYLHTRGISDEIIKSHKIGYAHQYGTYWIAIPIKNIDGNYRLLNYAKILNMETRRLLGLVEVLT